MGLLENQTAVVTGASSGIGAEIACAMGREGARVVVNYRSDKNAAEKVLRAIHSDQGEATAFQADVSKEEQVDALFAHAGRAYGTVDIVVCNAGIQKDASFLDMTYEQWQTVLNVNLGGAFLCAREAAREFVRRGVIPERSCAAGKILFISSVHEVIPWSGHVNYAASKGGMMLLMKSIAQELAVHRIRVNSIAPGAVKTDINRDVWEPPQAAAELRRLIPYDRIGEPGDVARVAVWLASDQADYVTGTTIYADGGMLLYPGFRTGG